VAALIPAKGRKTEDILRLAAALERRSEHPLGQAVVRAAQKEGLSLPEATDFAQIPGTGLSGKVEGITYMAGNRRIFSALGLEGEASGELEEMALSLSREGKTGIFLASAKDGCLGLIALADTLKESSPAAVRELRSMGLKVIMLTGDGAGTAEAIREQAGIETAIAEVFPQDKEREIRRLQESGRKVAMVGDGVNDAPALSRADLGIAIGAGTDIAAEAADVILMRGDLLDVATAIQLSRQVMANIRQNLFWAFFYNLAGIPVAAGLFYPSLGLTLNPMIAAAAMSLSSVSVVTNALRLRFFKPASRPAPSPSPPKTSGEPGGQITIESRLGRPDQKGETMVKKLKIEGMSCNHCSARVEQILGGVPGVTAAKVDLSSGTAEVSLETEIPDELLTKPVSEAGYAASIL
jgi:cation transport ATPase